MTTPPPATVDELDLALIKARRALADAEQQQPRHAVEVAVLRETFGAARAARGWPYGCAARRPRHPEPRPPAGTVPPGTGGRLRQPRRAGRPGQQRVPAAVDGG